MTDVAGDRRRRQPVDPFQGARRRRRRGVVRVAEVRRGDVMQAVAAPVKLRKAESPLTAARTERGPVDVEFHVALSDWSRRSASVKFTDVPNCAGSASLVIVNPGGAVVTSIAIGRYRTRVRYAFRGIPRSGCAHRHRRSCTSSRDATLAPRVAFSVVVPSRNRTLPPANVVEGRHFRRQHDRAVRDGRAGGLRGHQDVVARTDTPRPKTRIWTSRVVRGQCSTDPRAAPSSRTSRRLAQGHGPNRGGAVHEGHSPGRYGNAGRVAATVAVTRTDSCRGGLRSLTTRVVVEEAGETVPVVVAEVEGHGRRPEVRSRQAKPVRPGASASSMSQSSRRAPRRPAHRAVLEAHAPAHGAARITCGEA